MKWLACVVALSVAGGTSGTLHLGPPTPPPLPSIKAWLRLGSCSALWLGVGWVGTSSPGLTVNNLPASFTSTSNNNNFGGTAGLRVEWAFAGNWSARAEWDVILLQSQSFTVSGSAFGTDTITVNNRSINMFTAALNYKFGGWGY